MPASSRERRLADGPSGRALAEAIGERLCTQAHWNGKRCSWIGHRAAEDGSGDPGERAISSLGPDLYAGTAGVALFLAGLPRAGVTPALRRTASGAISHALEHAAELPPDAGVGLYAGRLGIALAAVEVGRFLDDGALRARGAALARDALAEPSGHRLDLIGGAAGGVLALLRLASLERAARFLEGAAALGAELERAALPQERGWAWEPERASAPGLARRPLTGLSHGASGMGLALAELHRATGRASFARAALRAFAYEDALFDRGAGNWPDLRDAPVDAGGGPRPRHALAWCHGAPGIGLARLRALEILGPRRALVAPARAAVAAVRRHLSAGDLAADLTPCHGLLGQLELLQVAARVLRVPVLQVEARRAWHRATRGLRPGEWTFGTASGGESPGLMVGLAGVGHCHLRWSEPIRVPSALVVHP